jgi:hypothetical protein
MPVRILHVLLIVLLEEQSMLGVPDVFVVMFGGRLFRLVKNFFGIYYLLGSNNLSGLLGHNVLRIGGN